MKLSARSIRKKLVSLLTSSLWAVTRSVRPTRSGPSLPSPPLHHIQRSRWARSSSGPDLTWKVSDNPSWWGRRSTVWMLDQSWSSDEQDYPGETSSHCSWWSTSLIHLSACMISVCFTTLLKWECSSCSVSSVRLGPSRPPLREMHVFFLQQYLVLIAGVSSTAN